SQSSSYVIMAQWGRATPLNLCGCRREQITAFEVLFQKSFPKVGFCVLLPGARLAMFITRVELENIKSYRKASIELHRGTTAIRGQDGEWKTHLVEAIGFALFDYLPYSQAQFVREGERSGQVTVMFQSGVDDAEYAVVRRCGTPSAWYVYDPQIDKRLV